MTKLHLTSFINASREKVWDTMLSDATYRDWTSAFNPGSYYVGDWSAGSKILFLGPGLEGGGEGGMVSRVAESRRPEFVSLEHLGFVRDGVEDTTSDFIKPWVGARENYTFNERDGGTELVVDVDVSDEERAFMEEAWKKGLERLKALCSA